MTQTALGQPVGRKQIVVGCPASQMENAPGSPEGHQGGEREGEKRELDGGDEHESTRLGRHRRHQRTHGDEHSQPEAEPTPECVSLRGLPCGSPTRHLVGRRWKKPQSSTRKSVPKGMAKVNAWVAATSDAVITCSPPLKSRRRESRRR
jgi:hypothetical protein